ncbi:MAG: prepilin-type N-terminal cleavage/methylation domain-containing protein [Acidobacteria bacterium]|nr:prepilin-type N-terminal cleavage/methylation domain-containing protein [Acidobacteriota bacterium]
MRRAFTLLELMVAVLLGALVVAMIAGSLTSSMRAWEAEQTRISENYERRTVLDMIKRQSSSIFYRRDADNLVRQDNSSPLGRRQANTPQQKPVDPRMQNQNQNRTNVRQNNVGNESFTLPGGAHFIKGGPQGISFLSTVSFLSDFPGQCAVKYFVVQVEEPSEDGSYAPPESLTAPEGFLDAEAEILEGGLWLAVEEKNLFVMETQQQEQPPPTVDAEGKPVEELENVETEDDTEEDMSFMDTEIEASHSLALLGPLRKFSVRYRIPKKHGADEEDTEEDWAESWDFNEDNGYPGAIEFILVFEKPGLDDHTETEDLPGIRMVIPVYDLQNMRRDRGNDVPF